MLNNKSLKLIPSYLLQVSKTLIMNFGGTWKVNGAAKSIAISFNTRYSQQILDPSRQFRSRSFQLRTYFHISSISRNKAERQKMVLDKIFTCLVIVANFSASSASPFVKGMRQPFPSNASTILITLKHNMRRYT